MSSSSTFLRRLYFLRASQLMVSSNGYSVACLERRKSGERGMYSQVVERKKENMGLLKTSGVCLDICLSLFKVLEYESPHPVVI